MDVREQITALREQLRYHNEKYYNEDAPEITDYEYDMLQRQLRALEAEHPEMADANSPTQRVGGTASSRFAKVTHAYRSKVCRMFSRLTSWASSIPVWRMPSDRRSTLSSTRSTAFRSRSNMWTACSSAVRHAVTVRWART